MTNGAAVIGHAERKRFRFLGSSVLAVVLPAAVIGHAERKRFRLLGSSATSMSKWTWFSTKLNEIK